MRVTEKGQVTIPKPVRDRLGIVPGSEVDFVFRDGDVHLIRVSESESEETESRGERAVRVLREAAKKYRLTDFTTDEIMDMTRGPVDDVEVDFNILLGGITDARN
jgi:AbrB family looped-hinge helix DNA binding protein